MKPYYSDPTVTIYHGDCRDVLAELDPVETIITDPPYGLAFMGRAWDHAVPGPEYWTRARGALLPGGHLLAFGGTRTFHRLACAIEDAGLELRDTLSWMYGTGYPKSYDVSKGLDALDGQEGEWVQEDHPNRAGARTTTSERFGQVDYATEDNPDGLRHVYAPATELGRAFHGYGTGLKPGWEPIFLAMAPLDGTFAENARAHGVAGLNVDGCRIETTDPGGRPSLEKRRDPSLDETKNAYGNGLGGSRANGRTDRGRWPANVVLDEAAAAQLDDETGELTGGGYPTRRGADGDRQAYGEFKGQDEVEVRIGRTSGGPSRFYYTAKASRSERGPGNDHPTVKPLDLMRWLCELTRPPHGGAVLDPFMGSGSTLLGALAAGRRAIGVELEERYCEIAARRLERVPFDLFTPTEAP